MHGYGGLGIRGCGFGGVQITMITLMIIFIALVSYMIFKVISNNRNAIIANNCVAKADINIKALEILNDRFANGEISEDEYIVKKKLLKE